ncbi:MAG: thio(seleno)oxazole modification radical SAM maturase SbtM [Alphaproteobacteria bacterium]|nr:thio(seleno)oxazole modification radical SAM maturase SbtM [Alphaproteobacteria bacterium]
MIRERLFGGRATTSFTLQWHLTNACAFDCSHCYERLNRAELSLDSALEVVAGLARFSARHHVTPQVCLTGGDPLRYVHFWALYQALRDSGMRISILGNPIPERSIERLMAIAAPDYYQVSLEGFEAHNDRVRGPGHFSRVMRFLDDARPLGLATHVMLTLTGDNMSEVIALGDHLRGRTLSFTFSRLAQVGSGASLTLPERDACAAFLRDYAVHARHNPVLRLKENLFCLVSPESRRHRGMRGCTGHGCGAAFNFVALLPDGEVHACRKFRSKIGSIHESTLDQIYQGETARRYRGGPEGCRDCSHRLHCNGCMAVVHGCGLDPFTTRDPFCFRAMPR